jgi:hypothetical protein
MGEKILSYRDLEVWKNGVKLAKDIYRVTETFPIAGTDIRFLRR